VDPFSPKALFGTCYIYDFSKPPNINFKDYFTILFKGFFLRPEMVFHREKLFKCFKNI
jgi:hypothetical protein